MSALQSPIRVSILFFCAGHYSGMGITRVMTKEEVMYVSKAVLPLKIVCGYELWVNSSI